MFHFSLLMACKFMSKVKCIYSVVPRLHLPTFLALVLELVLIYFSVTALVIIRSQYHIHRTRRMLQEGEPFAWSHNGRPQPAVPPRSAGK